MWNCNRNLNYPQPLNYLKYNWGNSKRRKQNVSPFAQIIRYLKESHSLFQANGVIMQLIRWITVHHNGLNGYREHVFPLLNITRKFQLQWKSTQWENRKLVLLWFRLVGSNKKIFVWRDKRNDVKYRNDGWILMGCDGLRKEGLVSSELKNINL